MLKIFTKSYLFFLIIILITLIHFLIVVWLALNMDIYYDGAQHVSIIEEIVKTKKLLIYNPFLKSLYGGSSFGNILIQYPPLYYIFGAVLFPIFGAKVIAVLEIIASTIIIPLIYFIFKHLYNRLTGVLSVLIIGLSPVIKFEQWDQDIPVAAVGILILLVYLKFLKKQNLVNIVILSFLMTIAVGIKQTAFFYIIAIFLHFFLYNILSPLFSIIYRKLFDLEDSSVLQKIKENKKKKPVFFWGIKKFILLLVFFIIISSPLLYYQISTTGSIFQREFGIKTIDNMFHLKGLETEIWQKELNEKVNIDYLRDKASEYYYKVNPKVSEFISEKPWYFFNKFFNIYKDSSVVVGADLQSIYSITSSISFIGTFLLLGITIFFFRINLERSVILFIIIVGLIPILKTSKIQYYIILPFISVIFIALALELIRQKSFENSVGFVYTLEEKFLSIIKRSTIFILISSIIVFSVINSVDYIAKAYNEANDKVDNESSLNIKRISKWLSENSDKDDIIMAPLLQFFPYYSKRQIFWDYRLFFLKNESDVLYYLKNYYNPRYIVIYDFQITNNFSYWVHIPRDSVFLKMIQKDNEYFEEVYNKEGIVKIYEFK